MSFNIFAKKVVVSKTTLEKFTEMFHPKNYHQLEKFYLYAVSEYSIENILGVVALIDFEREPTKMKRDFIMDNFIVADANYPVNISNLCKKRVEQAVVLEDIKNLASVRARRNNRSGAFFSNALPPQHRSRSLHVPLELPQMRNTFESAALKENLMCNFDDTYKRFTIANQKILFCIKDNLFSTHREIISIMQTAGFTIPRFMLKMKGI